MPEGSIDRAKSPHFPDAKEFFDKYTTAEVLGRGVSSTVKRCVENATGLEFAVKMIDLCADGILTPESAEIYSGTVTEIAVLRLLAGHPNIITLQDVYESSTMVIIIFELCRKGELFDYMTKVATMSEKQTKKIMKQLMLAVNYMHSRGVVHRDLKPENILIDDQLNIKVTDFGFAGILPDGHENCFVDLFGTPGYLAPEVLRLSFGETKEPYGKAVDLWACGVIMYSLLVGYPPFYHRKQMIMLRLIKDAQFTLTTPEWTDITQPTKNLIKHFLVPDPRRRITAEDALQHEYFEILSHKTLDHGGARKRLKRVFIFVRSVIRIKRQPLIPKRIYFTQVQQNPFSVKALRKLMDTAAFRIYGHWVKKGEEQNRADLFQMTVKADMRMMNKI